MEEEKQQGEGMTKTNKLMNDWFLAFHISLAFQSRTTYLTMQNTKLFSLQNNSLFSKEVGI